MINKVLKLFGKKKMSKKDDPTLFKIGGYWGNSIQWQEFDKGTVHGWKAFRPTVGDLITSEMVSGKTCVFEFVKVELCRDPHDMFFGWVKPVGYEDDLDLSHCKKENQCLFL